MHQHRYEMFNVEHFPIYIHISIIVIMYFECLGYFKTLIQNNVIRYKSSK